MYEIIILIRSYAFPYMVFLYINLQLFSLTRSNDNSFSRGVLSERSYIFEEKRRLVNLKMCFMAWLYELLGVISSVLSPFLHNLGFHNIHYPDVILMFVVIPFVHMMNDEETKAIIADRNWYQGLRHMLGIYTQVEPVVPEGMPQAEQNLNRRVQHLPPRNEDPISPQEPVSPQGPNSPQEPILPHQPISP